MEFRSYNQNPRYVPPPNPNPNNFSDRFYHVGPPPPPPLSYLPPPPPPPPPSSYQSHFTFLDSQNPSYNRSSSPSRFSNYRFDSRSDRRLYPQSEIYYTTTRFTEDNALAIPSNNDRLYTSSVDRIYDQPKWVMNATRVKEESKQVQKKSVLLRIGKPNNTSSSSSSTRKSNNTRPKDKHRPRDSIFIDTDTEHDISFKSNTSSPLSDSQSRNRKAKRLDSPLSKFKTSTSEKQSRDKDSVLDQPGAPLSFSLRKKRKLRNLASNALNFQLPGKDDKSVNPEENLINSSSAPTLLSNEVDKSSITQKDGLEIKNRDFFTENSNLNDGLENHNQVVSTDVKLSLGGTDISTTSGQDQKEIQKFLREPQASFGASNVLNTLCNPSFKRQQMSITAGMNSLNSCSDEIIIASPENSEVQGFDDVSRKDDESQLLEGTSIFTEDVSKESQNVVVVSVDSKIFSSSEIHVFGEKHENVNDTVIDVCDTPSSFKETCSDNDGLTEMVNSISTSVQIVSPDRGEPGTDETYLLSKDDEPFSSTVAFVTDSANKSGESIPDMLTSIVSSQQVSSFSDSQVLTSELTGKTISNLNIPMNDENICEKSVSKDGALVNGPESFLGNSRTGNNWSLLKLPKTVSSASRGSSVKIQASTTKLQGSNLSMTKPGSVSAIPRVFTGRSNPVFTNSRVNNPAKPRTWHRSTSNPPPPKQMGQNSYVRSGNTLVRKSASVTAVASVPSASRTSVHELNPSGPIEIRNTTLNSTYSRVGGSGAPVLRPNTPPLSSSTKLPDCTTYSRDLSSLPLEHLREDQNGASSNFKSQKTSDEGGAGKKTQYVKRKSNQLVAASTTDQPIQDILSSDGYYKRRKNQLIRTSVGEDTVNTYVPKVSKINIKRHSGKGISKKYKHLRFPSVWTLGSQSSGKDGVSLHQKLRPHLFPWKRSRNWRHVMNTSASFPSKSLSLLVSRKLLLSRKREMIYTRSKHGFSLRMSKLLSVGGSSLKWSKSIEKNSKNANEEATLAVAAAEQKKREHHGTSETKNRNNISSDSHNRDRIFRIGLVRYKMDPSRMTLQRISDEKPSTSMQSKEVMRKSYIPKRLKIGHNEYVRIGNGNQLVRNPKRRTRIFANEKVRWSLHTARSRLAKKKRYCQFFTRFGKCNKDDGKCPYIHDSSKIAVCTKFLRGSCPNLNCNLTHKVIPERMQDCSYFLQGLCSNKDCPYRHVNVNSAASICEGFLKGFCAYGNECRKKHTYACPVFEATGACSHGAKCKLHHPRNRNMGLMRKQHSVEQNQKNGRGRYFGSIIGGETMQISDVKDDDEVFQEGQFADFIGLGFSSEEAGEATSYQRTMLISEPSDLGADEFDDLTKPIGIMEKTVFDAQSDCDLGN